MFQSENSKEILSFNHTKESYLAVLFRVVVDSDFPVKCGLSYRSTL